MISKREVTLTSAEGNHFNAYLAVPAMSPAPGIVVLQEIFGVNADMRAVADDLAAQGYLAIVPDLFWRQQPGIELNGDVEADRGRAYQLYQGMNEALAVKDGIAALDHLRSMSECNGSIGALGYCLGGKLAYLVAARAKIDAAVSYYGVGVNAALDEAGNISAPLLLHVAGADHLCPPPAQQQLIEALTPLEPKVKVVVHDGVGHAFAREGSQSFVPEAAARANQMTREFFRTHLGQ
jgi:carboxymethylenebutenolidase